MIKIYLVSEVVKVALVQCNLADNQYQQKSQLLYTFMPNISYAYMLNMFTKLMTI